MDIDSLITKIELIISKLDQSTDNTAKFKIVAYANVIKTLQLYSKLHSSHVTEEQFKHDLASHLTKPMMTKLLKLNEDVKPTTKDDRIQAYLATIPGMNAKKMYLSFIESGMKDVDKFLIKYGNEQTAAYVRYKPLSSIPRSLISEIDSYIAIMCKKLQDKYVDRVVDVIITGSYRRGAQQSGDIDLLLRNISYKEFISMLTPTSKLGIVHVYANGDKKTSAICKFTAFDHKDYIMIIDFFIANDKDFIFQLLYTTGSKNFNLKMRSKAKHMGLTLNQYELRDVETDKALVINDEKEVFAAINMTYIDPSQRS